MNDKFPLMVSAVLVMVVVIWIMKHGVPLPPPINVEAVVELDGGLYNVLAPLKERTVVLSAELPTKCTITASIPVEITLMVDDKFNSQYVVSQTQQNTIYQQISNICAGGPHY